MASIPKLVPRTAILLSMLLQIACNEETGRFEQLFKLRALGVSPSPVVSKPSTAAAPQVVTLTFHAVLPLGQTATYQPYVAEGSAFFLPVLLTMDASSEKYQDLAQFRHYQIKGTAPIPDLATLALFLDRFGSARLRFGLKLETTDGEVEKIITDAMVYPDASEKLTWSSPTAQIANPADNVAIAAESDTDIKAEITNPNGEPVKLGWFVSAGKVKNRRAKETVWTSGAAGDHTLILTVRGKLSRGFDIKFVKVVVQ